MVCLRDLKVTSREQGRPGNEARLQRQLGEGWAINMVKFALRFALTITHRKWKSGEKRERPWNIHHISGVGTVVAVAALAATLSALY